MCVNILRNVTVQLRCRHECLQFSTNFIFLTHPPFAIVPFYSVFFLWFSVSFIDGLKTSYPKYLARHLINVARIHPCIVLIMRATHENKMKCTEIANKKNPSVKWTKMSEREIEEMQNETDKRTATEAAATNGTGQSRENINKENTCIYVWNGIEIFRRSEREWRVNGEKRHTHTHTMTGLYTANMLLFLCLFASKFVIPIFIGPCKWYTNRCAENLNTCIAEVRCERDIHQHQQPATKHRTKPNVFYIDG